ncbi:MAG: Gldg family protein [Pseudobacteriovorax sp.]|nr:Gldg family protein [Pseudobacteriovorax sp.]
MNHHVFSLRVLASLSGLVLFFVTERYFFEYTIHYYSRGTALALLVVGSLLAFLNAKKAKDKGHDNEAKIWNHCFLWQSLLVFACVFYLAYAVSLGDSQHPETALQKVLLGLWLVVLTLSVSMGIGFELGTKSGGRQDTADPLKVSLQGVSWLKVGMVLVSLFAVNYTVAKYDKVFDLSFLKTAKPGEATLNITSKTTSEISIAAFFKKDSDVGPQVRSYLEQIAASNELIQLSFYDKDFSPVEAETFRVAKNGQIVLMQEKKRQRIDIGEKLSIARSKLARLDQNFQKAFLALTAEKKNIYLTQGHGEMSSRVRTIPTRSASQVSKLLRGLNYNVRTLDAEKGGFFEVPSDAAAVVILGASRRFSDTEISVLEDYLTNGGSLLVFLDVEFGGQEGDFVEAERKPLLELLLRYGIKFSPTLLVNDKQHVRATRKAIDRAFLISNNFSSHVSVKSLSKNDEKLALITFQSGYLDSVDDLKEGWKAIKIVQTRADTFADLNRNLKLDKDSEKRQSYAVGMISESENAKIMVFADATMASDPLQGARANQIAMLDAIRWLAGQESIMGKIDSEEDVKIQHSKSQELLIFHIPIYLVPLLVLVFGLFANRRRKVGQS